MIILHASIIIIVHACAMNIVHACTRSCYMHVLWSYYMHVLLTIIIVHACTMIIVHACPSHGPQCMDHELCCVDDKTCDNVHKTYAAHQWPRTMNQRAWPIDGQNVIDGHRTSSIRPSYSTCAVDNGTCSVCHTTCVGPRAGYIAHKKVRYEPWNNVL